MTDLIETFTLHQISQHELKAMRCGQDGTVKVEMKTLDAIRFGMENFFGRLITQSPLVIAAKCKVKSKSM